MRLLTAADVRTALPMALAIDAMREAFPAVSAGTAEVPLRTHISLPDDLGATLTMSAATSLPVQLGSKLLTIFPHNPERGLPFIHGLVVMFDETTGRPKGLLEGMTLTALRTGAASGLATDLLARRDASRVAILGSGAQARTQLEAVCCVRSIEHAAVYSRTTEHAARFAAEMSERPDISAAVEVATSAAKAANHADIICTATGATVPLLVEGDVRPGAHVNAVGSFTPDMRELSSGLIAGSAVVVDQRAAALAEAGELIAAVTDGATRENDWRELGDVVSGAAPARERNDQITLFKSVGLAVQDLYAAAWALRRAEAEGIGNAVDLLGNAGTPS